jgi:hypothetical protein
MSAAGHLNPAVPKPAHIPDELVYDYDAYRDPELLADPSKRIAREHLFDLGDSGIGGGFIADDSILAHKGILP